MVEEYEQNANLHLLMHDLTQKKKVQCGKPLAIIGIHKTLMQTHVKTRQQLQVQEGLVTLTHSWVTSPTAPHKPWLSPLVGPLPWTHFCSLLR